MRASRGLGVVANYQMLGKYFSILNSGVTELKLTS